MRYRCPNGGFSLVEVMCAIAVLAVGLLGLTEALGTALRSTKESELTTAAALCASGLIETLRAEGYYTDGVTEGDFPEDIAPCHWRQTLSSTEIAGLHDVTVVIEHARTGKVMYELRTLLFEPPLDSQGGEAKRRRELEMRSRERGGG